MCACHNSTTAYFVGIDGGGSQTTCVLGDEEKVLASVTAGGSNIVRVGRDEAATVLQHAVQGVCRKAGTKPAEISAVYAGIAGATREEIKKQLSRILAKLTRGQIEITGDMVIAHHAALRGEAGIVVLAGTGSIAFGMRASGHTARAGGWGFSVSDEGSGHWIGVQAAAAIVHALDSGAYTRLSDLILQRWRLGSYDEFISCASSYPAPDFSSLFPDVLVAAKTGDSYAANVLSRAGGELAVLAEVVFRRLWRPDDAIDVGLAGGVFMNSSEVRESCERRLQRSIPQARVFLSTASAADAALSLARTLAAVHR